VAKQTRRSFLQNTTVTAASAAAATFSLLPGLTASAAMRRSPQAAAPLLPAPSSAASTGPMVIHISDAAKGEMTFLVGARETVLRDPGLVARLTEAARRGDSPNKT
jgi:hypothetical protein